MIKDEVFLTFHVVLFHEEDDNAATDVKVRCGGFGGSSEVLGGGANIGDWGEYMACPKHTFICGVRAHMEQRLETGDDTALNKIQLACCKDPGKSSIVTLFLLGNLELGMPASFSKFLLGLKAFNEFLNFDILWL